MSLLDNFRAERLIALARTRFDPSLTEAELQVLMNSASSEDSKDSEAAPPDQMRPVVRAQFLRWLVTDREPAAFIDQKGVRANGAKISSDLDLSECHLSFPIVFRFCLFPGKVDLRNSEMRGISIWHSRFLQGINADAAAVHGTVILTHADCSGRVSFSGAQIDENLDCTYTQFKGSQQKVDEEVFSLYQATIKGNVSLMQCITTGGAIDMSGVHFHGNLNCSSSCLSAPRETMKLLYASIDGNVYLTRPFQSSGIIDLYGAHIGGSLDCSGAKLIANGDALKFANATIGGDVYFIDHFSSTGRIYGYNAQITGSLTAAGANFAYTHGDALDLSLAKIQGDLILKEGCRAAGRILMSGVHIGGALGCSGANLSAQCTENDPSCSTLDLKSATVGNDVILNNGFSATAPIVLTGARIGGDLQCQYSDIASLQCANLQLSGTLHWIGMTLPKPTALRKPIILKLTNATVKSLRDDRNSWPDPGTLDLDDFSYQDLILHEAPSETDAKHYYLPRELDLEANDRISWIMRQGSDQQLNPQPWMQLASVFTAEGKPDGAKAVIYAFRRRQARSDNLLSRGGVLIYYWIEGDPIRVLVPIFVLWLFGSLIFWRARRMQAMTPIGRGSRNDSKAAPENSEAFPPFNPWIYTLENVLPVVKLGQDDKWGPDPNYQQRNWFPNQRFLAWTRHIGYAQLAWIRYLLILLGWVLALVLAAAIGSRFKS